MTPVFADTSYFLALINPRDPHYRSAMELSTELMAPLLTTAWVLLEVANGLSSSRWRGHFKHLRSRIIDDPNAEVIAPNPELYERGCDLYTSRPDKDWSLTDCISFEVMRERGLADALTADHHFTQAGFNALLLPA